jgi:hypothetical protein
MIWNQLFVLESPALLTFDAEKLRMFVVVSAFATSFVEPL